MAKVKRVKNTPPIEVRDCDNCKHHVQSNKGMFWYHYCTSWECEFEPKEEKSDE